MSDQDLTSPTTDPFATAPAAEQVVVDSVLDELPADEVAEAIIEAEEAIEDAEAIVEAEAEAEVVAEADALEEAAAEEAVVDEAEAIVEAEAEEAEDEDPVAAFREQMRIAPGDWYVIHSYAGYENKVKGNIETRITTMNMEDYIFQVEVPMEEVTEIKSGVRKLVRRNKFPGYVLVRMDLTDESWGAIRHTPGVTGFVGHGHQPAPLSLDEVVNILAPDPGEEAGRGRRLGGRPAASLRPSRSRSTSRSATPSPSSMARSPRSTPPSPRSTSRPRRSPASSRSSVARLLSSWPSARSSRTSSTSTTTRGAPPPG